MKRKEIEQSVCTLFSNVLGRRVEPGQEVVRAEEPAWNSLKHIELFFSIEGQFDIRFTEEELAHLDRLRTITERVGRYVEA